jgi:hypothetical protein
MEKREPIQKDFEVETHKDSPGYLVIKNMLDNLNNGSITANIIKAEVMPDQKSLRMSIEFIGNPTEIIEVLKHK